MTTIVPMASNIAGGWAAFYSMIAGIIPGIWTAFSLIGIFLFFWGLGGYLWRKFRQRSGQGDNKKLIWSMIIAAAFVSPQFIFPMLTKFADALLNGPGEAMVTKVQSWL